MHQAPFSCDPLAASPGLRGPYLVLSGLVQVRNPPGVKDACAQITATEEASMLETHGKMHESRIQGMLLADGALHCKPIESEIDDIYYDSPVASVLHRPAASPRAAAGAAVASDHCCVKGLIPCLRGCRLQQLHCCAVHVHGALLALPSAGPARPQAQHD